MPWNKDRTTENLFKFGNYFYVAYVIALIVFAIILGTIGKPAPGYFLWSCVPIPGILFLHIIDALYFEFTFLYFPFWFYSKYQMKFEESAVWSGNTDLCALNIGMRTHAWGNGGLMFEKELFIRFDHTFTKDEQDILQKQFANQTERVYFHYDQLKFYYKFYLPYISKRQVSKDIETVLSLMSESHKT